PLAAGRRPSHSPRCIERNESVDPWCCWEEPCRTEVAQALYSLQTKEPIMPTLSTSLRILIGAACADPNFADQLMSDPEGAAQSLGICLSPEELAVLNDIVTRGKGNDLPDALVEVNRRICPPGGPCPW